MTKPQQSRTVHVLPYQELSFQNFQRLTYGIVSKEGFTKVEYYGGPHDQGRDVIAYKGEALWYFQCKNTNRIRKVDLYSEVDKIRNLSKQEPSLKPKVIAFVLSCGVSPQCRDEVRKYAKKYRFNCEFWARFELDAKVKKHKELVEEFFYPCMENHHGIAWSDEVADLIHRIETYLYQYRFSEIKPLAVELESRLRQTEDNSALICDGWIITARTEAQQLLFSKPRGLQIDIERLHGLM